MSYLLSNDQEVTNTCFTVSLIESVESNYLFKIDSNTSVVTDGVKHYLENKINTFDFWNVTSLSVFSECYSWRYHNCNEEQICFHNKYTLQSRCIDILLMPNNETSVSSISIGQHVEYCDDRFQHHSVTYNSQCILFVRVRRTEVFNYSLCARKLNSDWAMISGKLNQLKDWV